MDCSKWRQMAAKVEEEVDGGQGGKVERECIGISWRLLLTIIWLSDAQ